MNMIKSKTGTAASMPQGIASGVCMSLFLTACFCTVAAVLLDREIIAWNNIGLLVMLGFLTSSFIGSKAAFGMIKRKKLLVCILTGTIYWLMLFCFTALFFDGVYDAVGVSLALTMSGCISAALLGSNIKRGGKKYTVR